MNPQGKKARVPSAAPAEHARNAATKPATRYAIASRRARAAELRARAAEWRLRQLERRYQALATRPGQWVWTIAAAAATQPASLLMQALVTEPAASARPSDVLAALHPDDRAHALATCAHALASATTAAAVVRIGGARGTDRTLLIRATPVPDSNGTTREWAGVTTDITELAARGPALTHQPDGPGLTRDDERLASAPLRTMLDVLPVGVAIVGARGDAQMVNDALLEIWGKDVPRATGTADFQGYLARWTDSGKRVAREEWALYRALTLGQITTDEEVEIETSDGQRKVILSAAAPIRDETNAIIGGISVITDITQRKQLEQQLAHGLAEFSAVVESVADIIVVFDAAGAVVRLNQAARALSERLRAGAVSEGTSGAPVDRIAPPLDEHGRLLPREQWPVHRILRGDRLDGAAAFEFMLRIPGLGERFFSLTGAPVYDAAGQIIGAVTATRDVTEQRQRMREMSARARELNAIFEAMSDAVVVVDGDGWVVRKNAAAEELYAHTVTPEWFTRPINERVRGLALFSDSGEPVPDTQWPAQRVLRGETLVDGDSPDIVYRDRDGRSIWLNASGVPLRDPSGHISGGVIVYRDVTERRLLEQRTERTLRGLLEMAATLVNLPHDAPLGTDAGDNLPATGTAAPAGMTAPTPERAIAQRLASLTCDVLGCRRVGIIAVEPTTEHLHPVAIVGLSPTQEAQWWEEQHALEARGQRLGDGADPDEMARFRGGEVFVLDMTAPRFRDIPNPYGITTQLIAPMRLGEQLVGLLSLDYGGPPHRFSEKERALAGAVAQLAAVVLERERLLRERAEAQAQVLALETTNEQMNAFVGIAGHELRTPLTSAKVSIQLAERFLQRLRASDATPHEVTHELERLTDLFQRAERQMQRQERLVRDLLDLSRIQEGQLELHMAPCDLVDLSRDAVEEQRLMFPGRTITLSLPDGGEHIPVYADADRIGQVLTNYLTNALKYSPEEEPVAVSLATQHGLARVCVRDHGPGLPAAELAHVWERFHRAPGVEVLSGSGVGLGLGLYISRKMIERQGGQVGAESAPGHGSTFSFALPLRADRQPS